jgi:hypothetical protein
VKEDALFHLQLPAAQSPVCPKEKMKSKDFVLEFIQNPLADQTEIRDIFFIFATPHLAPVPAADNLEPRMAHMLLLLQTVTESCVAAPKDTSEDTIAGRFRALPAFPGSQSKSLALLAGFLR